MIRSRLGPKSLGMFALVLGLMAVWVGVPRAESTGGSWTYIRPGFEDLKTFEGPLPEPAFDAKLEAGTVGILHVAEFLPGKLLLYECKALSVSEGKLKLGGEILGRITFKECEAFIGGVLSTPCNPNAKGTQPGVIETLKLKAVMLLHKLATGTVDKILVVESDEPAPLNNNLAIVESIGPCEVGQKVPIRGKFAVQDSEPTTHKVYHLYKEFAPLTNILVVSNVGLLAANILGRAEAFLTAVHLSYKWAGLWN